VTEDELRAVFDAPEPLTVGLEEEVMLVDPATLRLADVASEVVGEGLKLELPASQLEVATAPATTVRAVIRELRAGRERVVERCGTRARAIAAGVHPFAAPLGVLSRGERYDAILHEYGDVARSQLVCALQVHVAVGSADATLPVYNALRAYLPELAALAANAPFHAGRDTGFASVRPLIGTLLPRQGVPPVIPSWTAFAEMLAWSTADPASWWWEVRPHVKYGTLEVRVCDTQTTLAEAAAIAAYVHALVAWLVERGGGEAPESWRISENRFAAARHGLDGALIDYTTGERRPVRELVAARLETLRPVAERLGCAAELAGLSLEANGAIRQRAVGLERVTGWLANRFLD
jgi:glutamate---cysteine ligase / carboxylate-amine ligase